jgi:DNA polymerase
MRDIVPSPAHKKQSSHGSESVEEKRQTVAGFIIFRKTEEGMKFLFLYRRGGYWNFPKGHFEKGEDAIRTALRETEEETGIKPSDLRIIPNFKTVVRFHFFHAGQKIHDTVILYLAESSRESVVVSPREHSGYAWFLYKDAMKMLGRYAGTKRALSQAYEFLHPRKPHANSSSLSSHPHGAHGHHPKNPAAGISPERTGISPERSRGGALNKNSR